jgi:restriction system protein
MSMTAMNGAPTMWGIHGGRTGNADALFLQQKYIGIGWHAVGALGAIAPDRESFKAKVAATYPQDKPGSYPVSAGQLYRFVHEMKIGDVVIYPSKQDRQIHIGQVTGEYEYSPTIDAGYPNLRKVEWLRSAPRTHFTQGALYEIGSAMSLFQVKNFADEFSKVMEGQHTPVVPPEQDETVAPVAEDIEDITRDFVLKQLIKEYKGHPFAHLVAHLLSAMGYRTRVSPPGPDGGLDIVAYQDELGLIPPIIKVQVKSGEGNIGNHDVQALYGILGNAEYGLFVTLAAFTPAARSFAANKSNLRLIDGSELVALILEHYDQFDSTHKARIPLKRVYVPEPNISEE